MTVRDTRQQAKAVMQRWPMKPEYREAIIRRMMRIIANPNSSVREVTTAAKALLAAESQNQNDEHKLADIRVATRHDQLSGIAADLGIEVGALPYAEGPGSDGSAYAAEPDDADGDDGT